MDELRATARLPGLDIDIARRETEGGEEIRIALRAHPSFEAVARLVALNPFLTWFYLNPFLAWPMMAARSWPSLPPPRRDET